MAKLIGVKSRVTLHRENAITLRVGLQWANFLENEKVLNEVNCNQTISSEFKHFLMYCKKFFNMIIYN